MEPKKCRWSFIGIFLAILILGVSSADAIRPNIVFVLCDDLGYGDVQCLNPDHGKIPTPNIDKLSREGMTFTDAHSGSSVCTPTRYGIMTGRYSWRTKLQNGVVVGYAPSLIAEDRVTLAGFLRTQGYHTAAIGKWHLNLLYLDPESGSRLKVDKKNSPPVGARIPDGPIHRGFDYFHGFHHSRNMDAVIENDRIIERDEVANMLPRLAQKSVAYIQSRKDKAQPFFLYLPLSSPHTPIVPTAEWKGKSGLGDYADFVMQTDDVVGQVTKALHETGFAESTLLIFSSDNGCSKAAKIQQLREKGHNVSAHYRGSKADIWDGGHRVPFMIRWPGIVKAGSTSNDLICLNDVYATLADVLDAKTPVNSCEDSISFLPQLIRKPNSGKRTSLIHHSFSGHFAYRSETLKLLLARGSGGWSKPNEKQSKEAIEAQLYDMSVDPSERKNLYVERPDDARRLLKALTDDITRGRTTEGVESPNDFSNIKLWKSGRDK